MRNENGAVTENPTLKYDIESKSYFRVAPRPFHGNHHAIELVGNKLYLIGGLCCGSMGKVQIYDHVKDKWSLGRDMPWSAGSVSTGRYYHDLIACGGITKKVGTVATCGKRY